MTRRTAAALLLGIASSTGAHDWRLATAASPGARHSHALTYDEGRGVCVLFGGVENGQLLTDTWEYDGRTWVIRSTLSLGAAADVSMGFHAAIGKVVRWGGYPYDWFTWTWDGVAWDEYLASDGPFDGPELFQGSAAAYDPDRKVLISFGGKYTDTFYLSDTWELPEAGRWVLAASSGPAGRWGHAITYDPSRRRIVLFGGGYLDDTWEYDGTSWSLIAPVEVPAARSGHTLTYHPGLGAPILTGGNYYTFAIHEDAWELLPTQGRWSWMPSSSPPSGPITEHAATFDERRGLLVVFGGYDGSHEDDRTWELVASRFLVGAGHGSTNPNRVQVFRERGAPSTALLPYGAAWGANVGGADLDGFEDEVLTGPGPGPVLGPQVRAFTQAGAPLAKVNFFSYGTLRYGVNVAGGHLDADAYGEILSAPGPGSVFGPQVRGFDVDGGAVRVIPSINFFAYATLRYGAVAVAGDVEGDGFAEVLTGPGPSPAFSAQVRGWNVDGGPVVSIPSLNFVGLPGVRHGVHVAAGDVDDDGADELACAPGPGPYPPRILGYDHQGSVSSLPGFDITPSATSYGASIAIADVEGDATGELLAAAGPDPAVATTVRAYDYAGALSLGTSFDAFPGLAYGATLAHLAP